MNKYIQYLFHSHLLRVANKYKKMLTVLVKIINIFPLITDGKRLRNVVVTHSSLKMVKFMAK